MALEGVHGRWLHTSWGGGFAASGQRDDEINTMWGWGNPGIIRRIRVRATLQAYMSYAWAGDVDGFWGLTIGENPLPSVHVGSQVVDPRIAVDRLQWTPVAFDEGGQHVPPFGAGTVTGTVEVDTPFRLEGSDRLWMSSTTSLMRSPLPDSYGVMEGVCSVFVTRITN